MERKDTLMDPVQTSISVIGGILDDHPYRPTLKTDLFGVLTENQKRNKERVDQPVVQRHYEQHFINEQGSENRSVTILSS